jgi:hypothetical protein
MAVELHQQRLRRPATVAIFGVVTLGLYSIGWYYRINREMRDFGVRHGDRELGATRPWVSAIAMTLGGIIVIPRLISLLRTVGRVQMVERIATGSERPAVGLRGGLTAAALLPLGSSAHRVGELFAVLSLTALVASTTRIQARLNAAWRQHPATPSRPEPLAGSPPPATPTSHSKPTPRDRSMQDLLERADQQRRDRVAREQTL